MYTIWRQYVNGLPRHIKWVASYIQGRRKSPRESDLLCGRSSQITSDDGMVKSLNLMTGSKLMFDSVAKFKSCGKSI